MLPKLSNIDWLRSLVSQKQIVIDSSPSTIQTIVNKQNRPEYQASGVTFKTPRSVPIFTAPQSVNLTALHLLHSIGVITTPIIPNLADLSSTWAIYRYFWAFAPNTNLLRLSSVAKEIDFHQKGLLSDEIGIGMVYWVMHRFLDGIAHLDVDVALRNPQIAQNMGIPVLMQNGGAKPDYVFASRNGGFAIVESKGTQSGRGASLDQIRRGLEQVPSIAFEDGTSADEYVIATSITEQETTVYVVDPPNDEKKHNKKDDLKRKFSVKDKEKFYQSTKRMQAAKLAAFAGAENIAVKIAGFEEEFTGGRQEPRERREIQALDASFVGQAQTITIRGYQDFRFSIFYGLADEIYRDINSNDFISDDYRHQEQPRYAEKLEGFQENFLAENERSVYSVDKDGTILEFSLVG